MTAIAIPDASTIGNDPPIGPVRRLIRVGGAFLTLGYRETLAYPLAFILNNLSPLAQPIIMYFVAALVGASENVGGDYYTFVLLGITTMTVMTAGLQAFGGQLQLWINQGRFETLLVEPVSWKVIPIGMVMWPILLRLFTASLALALGIVAFGAHIDVSGLPLAIVVLLLGITAGHGIALLAASILILSKRADPVIVVYQLVVSVLSGVLFPVDLLPGWLQAVSYAVPHTHVLTTIRRLLMSDGAQFSGPGTWTSIGLLLGFIVLVYPTALTLYSKSLDHARRTGVLAGY